MDEKLLALIEALGEDGLTAFYVYLAVDYSALLLVIAVLVWSIHKVFAFLRNNPR